MKERTTLIQAEREGLAAIARARLNPPKADVDAATKRSARERATALGHDLGKITPHGASGQLVGRCKRCDAAVVFRPDDMVGNPVTGDLYGGSAVTKECGR